MDEDRAREEAERSPRCQPVFVARLLGAYLILVTVACVVLLALFWSSTNRDKALRQEMSSNGIGSNGACQSCCDDLRKDFDQCLASKYGLEDRLQQQAQDYGSAIGSIDGLQMKFDRCVASKAELEAKCSVATEQGSALNESTFATEEMNARLNSSLAAVQHTNKALNASNLECFRSNAELRETNADLEARAGALEATALKTNETIASYAEENDGLERLNGRLSEQVDELTALSAEYARQNALLNQSLAEARQHEEDLSALNRDYARRNDALNETTGALTAEVDELKMTTAALGATAAEYRRLNGVLSESIVELEEANEGLAATADALNARVADLSGSNARLSELNDDLGTIVSFLDEAADGIEENYISLAAYLSDQISESRGLLVQVLANTYRQITYYWACAVDSRFAGTAFLSSPHSPMGPGAYSDVVRYIDEILLSELCLDLADFEQSVTKAGRSPSDVTWRELMAFVADFVAKGIEYYFPRDGENGLGETDWAEAGYTCEGLPPNKQF